MKNSILTTLVLGAIVGSSFAETADYRIQAVTPTIKLGEASDMAVTITNKSGKPVDKARITAVKLDMVMEGMDNMAMPVKQVPSTKPGEYHFSGNVMHAGTWKLSVTARIPGESEPVNSTISFTAE